MTRYLLRDFFFFFFFFNARVQDIPMARQELWQGSDMDGPEPSCASHRT